MAWYSIDPIFYTSQRPDTMTDEDVSTNETRRVFIDEVFQRWISLKVRLLCKERWTWLTILQREGPIMHRRNQGNGSFEQLPSNQKWAGIMRSLSSTNFEQANVEFVQFWVLDPYVDGVANSPGELVLNFGNISEDILKDGKKQYENGLPGVGSTDLTSNSSWGKVPATQSLVYAFDAAAKPTVRCKI